MGTLQDLYVKPTNEVTLATSPPWGGSSLMRLWTSIFKPWKHWAKTVTTRVSLVTISWGEHPRCIHYWYYLQTYSSKTVGRRKAGPKNNIWPSSDTGIGCPQLQVLFCSNSTLQCRHTFCWHSSCLFWLCHLRCCSCNTRSEVFLLQS